MTDAAIQHLTPAGSEEEAAAYGLAPGVRAGDLIFVSGQLGVDQDGSIPASGARQAELAFLAVQRVLQEGGASLTDIIQLQTFHKGGMAATNEWFLPVKDRFIHAPHPSWTGIGVADIGGEGALIEIGAIARVSTTPAEIDAGRTAENPPS
jgi:enamine deaminase RidA (YjgF/YER057c/UK114 family)